MPEKTTPARKQLNIEAIERLLRGEVSKDAYRAAVIAGQIDAPTLSVWQALDTKWNSISKDDYRWARAEHVSVGEGFVLGENGRYDNSLKIADISQDAIDDGYRLIQSKEDAIAQNLIDMQAEIDALTLDQVLAGEGDAIKASYSEVPLEEIPETEDAPEPEPAPLIELEAPTDQESWETTVLEAPDWTEIIDGQTVTHKGVGKRIHFKDTLTGESFFINPAEESAAADAVQREIENNRLRLLAQGKQLDLDRAKFDWNVLIQKEQDELAKLDRTARDEATARTNELADAALAFEKEQYEFDKERYAQSRADDLAADAAQKELAQQQLILEKGPGAAAVAQAIQQGARSIDSSLIGEEALDFLGVGKNGKIALDTGISAAAQLDAGTKGYKEQMFDDDNVFNPELETARQTGQVGYLPTDKPLGAAFSALDNSDKNSVMAIANVLGLDLNKRLEDDRTAVPSSRGVFATMRRA